MRFANAESAIQTRQCGTEQQAQLDKALEVANYMDDKLRSLQDAVKRFGHREAEAVLIAWDNRMQKAQEEHVTLDASIYSPPLADRSDHIGYSSNISIVRRRPTWATTNLNTTFDASTACPRASVAPSTALWVSRANAMLWLTYGYYAHGLECQPTESAGVADGVDILPRCRVEFKGAERRAFRPWDQSEGVVVMIRGGQRRSIDTV